MIMEVFFRIRSEFLTFFQQLKSLTVTRYREFTQVLRIIVHNSQVQSFRVQQIVNLLIVNFHIRYENTIFLFIVLFKVLKDVFQRMNDQPLLITSTQHSISLATRRLPVHKNGRILTLEKLLDNLFAGLTIHLSVILILGEYMVVGELVYVVFLDDFGLSAFHDDGGFFV